MLSKSLFSPNHSLCRWVLALSLFSTPLFGFAEPLRVALSPDYPPLAFKEDGKLVGIEVTNAREVAKILGRDLQFVEMPMQEFIPALKAGRVDVVMSGFSATPERQTQVAFAQAFMEIGQMAIIRVDDAGRFAQPRALYRPGVRIGVEPDTTGDAYARENFGQAIFEADEGNVPFFCGEIPRLVETRGGDYFFIPSLTALRMIGEGIIDPT